MCEGIEKIKKLGSAVRKNRRGDKVCIEFKPLLKDGTLSDERFHPSEMTRKGRSCFEDEETAEELLNDLKGYDEGEITASEFMSKWDEDKTGIYL